jgi:hypothetical protein
LIFFSISCFKKRKENKFISAGFLETQTSLKKKKKKQKMKNELASSSGEEH